MKDRLRIILRVTGLLLVAAALGIMGYALYNIIHTDLDTKRSLQAADELVSKLKSPSPTDDFVLEDFDRPDYTPPPMDEEDTDLVVPADNAGTPQGSPAPALSAAPDETGAPAGTAAPKPTAKKVPILGVLIFDGLGGRKVPVVEGASAASLNRGAGHHPRTSLPGRTGNCVIFGHRNTVFSGFKNLKVGQTVRFQGAEKTYTYKITDMRVVSPDDPAIFTVHSGAVMSLVTCYPFNFVGSAPNRYLVTCELAE